MKLKLLFISFLFLVPVSQCLAQEVIITRQLKDIENGQADRVKQELPALREKYPDDPSVLFLEAVLTEEGKDALVKFSLIVNNYPQSRYADAALYRIYSYYYSMGLYTVAENYSRQLRLSYPDSPYLKYLSARSQKEIRKDNVAPEPSVLKQTTADTESDIVQPAESYSSKYTIQVGAFMKLENALSLKKALESKKYECEISLKEIAGSTLNVLTVGHFQTEAEAKRSLEIIDKEFKLNGRVTLVNN